MGSGWRRGVVVGVLTSLSAGLWGCVVGDEMVAPAPRAPAVKAQAAVAVSQSPWYEGTPGAGVNFRQWPAQDVKTDPGWSPLMTDVIQHLPASYGSTYYDSDKITYVHETSHGIHAHLRNNLNDTGQRVNAFYVMNDRAVLVVEPGLRKSQVARYVPQALRGSRFGTYVTGQTAWDDRPLYIWDEWNAYINGGQVGVELVQEGKWSGGWRDGVAGQLEFTVYAIATAMAVHELDPEYFEANAQFREFLAFNTRRAMEVYYVGAELEDFAWERQDNYLQALREAPDAEPLRGFAREIFGEAWANAVLFGGDALPPQDGDIHGPGDNPPPDSDGEDFDNPDPPEDDGPEGDDDDFNDPDPPANENPEGDDDDFNDPDPPADEDDTPPHQPDDRPPPDSDDDRPDPPSGDDDDFNDPGPPADDEDDTPPHQPDNRPPADNGDDDMGGPPEPPVDPPGDDIDGDGVVDDKDLCNRTPRGAVVWRTGPWLGCAGGERRDRLPEAQGADADRDGIEDRFDLCSQTEFPALVWAEGPWMGCAEGQFRDPVIADGLDQDGDGVADEQDLCSDTSPDAPVWFDGPWTGCAEGQLRD